MSDIDSNMLERLHQQSEEIMRLRAEIERLHAALREIADHPKDSQSPGKLLMQNIARAALEGK